MASSIKAFASSLISARLTGKRTLSLESVTV